MDIKTNTLPIDVKRYSVPQILLLTIGVLLGMPACAQPSLTANDVVATIPEAFDYGSNMGHFPPFYDDKALANLAHSIGATSIRPGLFHYFLETWGYESRKPQFQYYDSIGLRNLVAILGFPAEKDRDSNFYCPGAQSQVFKNLYEPIWDQGENGTPVNDANPFALYIWKTATTYKGLIKTYEIWNEPDLDTGNGSLLRGQPDNWWENTPQACETKLKSPPFYYIRMLRISYEVIKSVDPEALVAVGGLGYPSFLDVICRYTDEPTSGKVEHNIYPLKGGAYFDCMSFHAYPHLDNSLREWDSEQGAFRNFRHSDAAVDGIWRLKNQFNAVLDKHGYNNSTYPAKIWICSEFNLPRKPFAAYIGSELAQVNFLTKAFVTAQINEMAQMHVYSIADEKPKNGVETEFAYMGLFENLDQVPIGAAKPNDIAWALNTTAQLLKNTQYSAERTAAMQLPEGVQGGAFRNKIGQYTYVLWAATKNDLDETTFADYSFPPAFTLKYMDAKPWHYSRTHAHYLLNARQLKLTGSPIFLTETFLSSDYQKDSKVVPNPTQNGQAVFEFWMDEEAHGTIDLFDSSGRLVDHLLENEPLLLGPHALPLNVSALANGIYYLRLMTPENNTTIGFVKQ